MTAYIEDIEEFIKLLSRGCYRSQRYEHPASLVMIGIENMGKLQ